MNENEQRSKPPEGEQPEEQHSLNHLELKLVLPESQWFDNLPHFFNYSSKKEQRIHTAAKEFAAAEVVAIPAGLWGLGDTFMEMRYAIHLAKKTDKKVVCQVQDVLLPFAPDIQRLYPNLELVSRIPDQLITDPKTFVLRYMAGGGNIHDVDRWVEGDQAATLQAIKEKEERQQAIQLEDFTTPEEGSGESIPDIFKPSTFSQSEVNLSDYTAGFIMQALGVPVQASEIEETSLFSPTPEQVAAIPQDLDYLLVPDAKEMPDMYDYRSEKSLDLFVWRAVFARLPKDKKVGIVMGVSHPRYCRDVIILARQVGLDIEIIQGSLYDLASQYLRAKTIVGVDSGTTHLARDVQVAAKREGREIKLKPFFNDMWSYFPVYGIVNTVSYVSPTIRTPQMAAGVVDFILS